MRTPTTLDEWESVLGSRVTRRHRLELASACPVCGGEDRFHVRIMASGKTLAGCRGCIDGRPEPERRAAFGAVLQALGCKPSKLQRSASQSALGREGPKPDLATRLWEAAGTADQTPAAVYLARRGVWPPGRAGPVRWLSARAAIAARLGPLPAATAGLAMFDWRRPGNPKLQAVSLEALTAAGQQTNPRLRQTRGSKRGCVFSVPGAADGPLHLCEGEADALAIRTWRAAEAWAVGGTAGFEAVVAALPRDRKICIEADAGGPGGRAAAATWAAISGRGGRPQIRWAGDDPAADLSADWFERAAIMENEGSASRTEAERLAWEAMMGSKT